MKTILVMFAVVGMSAPAFAECTYHKNISAEAEIDKTITTASVEAEEQKAADPILLKKGDRLPTEQVVTE